ncbi:Stk1 family PASTA domain-containing Ser/Thr kinase [Clostridium sediminicola]|uniref:Stk1 family PASTA domain-containing Ser/Thr kinase n=1 Tax=Clostridium sediminicola TaxID=3114879 RepID=UPI0031F22FD0
MIGTILDNRYEILEKIGEGGMAEVFKAKCNLLHRFVAIKILKKQYYENDEFVNKFRAEALAIAVLSHDNIVGIYDIGNDKGLIYIIMEYMDGKNLKQLIKEEKVMDNDRVLNYAIQIGSALKCAHNKNIVHRDIKPHNILLNGEGNIKITDFGIAKATSSATITNSERIVGSAHYISPEQAKGNVVDSQTDIYSFGVVLYELVTGEVPFDAVSPVAVALKHIQENVKPPIEVNPNIPIGLNSIILKCLEKEKFKRYKNAGDVLKDLLKIKNNPSSNIDSINDNEVTRIITPINLENELNELANNKDEDDNDNAKNKKTKKKSILIALFTIVAAVAIFFSSYVLAGNKFNSKDNTEKSPDYINVPAIVGLQKEEAEILLNKFNLKLIPTVVKSTEEKGTIVQCYPYEGSEIDKNEISEIKVLVSSGVDTVTVPDLQNISFEKAKEIILKSNISFGKVEYINHENIAKNNVVWQSLKAGSEVKETSVIDLKISEGKAVETTYVPLLVQKKYNDAVLLIEKAKLILGEVNQVTTGDKALDSQVIIQSLEQDLQVEVNTKISLTYYVYKPELVKAPKLVGKTILQAKEIMGKLDLVLLVDGEDDFIIVSQNINAGTEIEKGSSINIQSEPSSSEPDDNTDNPENPDGPNQPGDNIDNGNATEVNGPTGPTEPNNQETGETSNP